MRVSPLVLRLAIACLSFIFILQLQACGRKGLPEPAINSELFSWHNVSAAPGSRSCINIHGEVSGSYSNLSSVVLELQPIDESCLGCPFVPMESHTLPATEIGLQGGSRFNITYCPTTPSTEYRWRLTGKNRVPATPSIQTPVRVITMPQDTLQEILE